MSCSESSHSLRAVSSSVAARLRETEVEREKLARRVARLEEELARKDQELLKLTQELERIRKTLRP